MDIFKYCSVRLKINLAKKPPSTPVYDANAWDKWFINSKAVVEIEKENVESFIVEGALRIQNPNYMISSDVYLTEPPLHYILPYLNKLGQEGWEVIEYKSSEIANFSEALLKRRIS